MIRLLSCAQGHFWEVPESGNGEAPSAPPCPVCGTPAETLPLLDFAPSDAPAPPPPPASTQTESPRDGKGFPVITGYEFLELVGRGPNGVMIYNAKQAIVNRTVLLKVVEAKNDPGQIAWGSLRGEAHTLGRLSHPNVPQIFEAGERDKQLFYNVVECIEGPTLAQATANKPLPWRQAVQLIEVLARAVHQAHEQGFVHRSLKPVCILLQIQVEKADDKKAKRDPLAPPFCLVHSRPCLPKIIDFGLARRAVAGDTTDLELQPGIPSYLSPEQAWARTTEFGPATDVYALGAIFYELLAGRPPFRGQRVAETLDHIQSKEPVPPSQVRSGVSADLDAVCLMCLRKQPRRRYRSALELADDLRRCLEGRPLLARPVNVFVRLGKWVRRRPGVVGWLLLCVLVACLAHWLGYEAGYFAGFYHLR